MPVSYVSNFATGENMSSVIRKLDVRIQQLEETASMDEVLRNKYPALQEAYEQFQIVKGLVVDEL